MKNSILSFIFKLFLALEGFGLGMATGFVKFENNADLQGFICPKIAKIFEFHENGFDKTKCLSLCAKKSSCFGVFYDEENGHCVGCGDKYLTNKSAVSQIGMKYYRRPTYMIVTEEMSWYESKVHCQELGGHLVDIKSMEEQTYIDDLFSRSSYVSKLIWIGASRRSDGGPFYWEDDSLINDNFRYWADGQPNNSPGPQNCVVVNWGEAQKWNDYLCNYKYMSICEYD